MDFLIWNNWVVMAMLTPFLWAVCCVTDVCLIGKEIYTRPFDGAVISGLFSIVPLLFLAGDVPIAFSIDSSIIILSMLAGLCYFLHVLFYFKALFVLNDSSSAETFISLSVLLVPIFAFFLLGERLETFYYFGIALAVSGALVLVRFHFAGLNRKAVMLLCFSVVTVSLSMVLQAQVLESVSYGHGVILFCTGSFVTALLVLFIKRSHTRRVGGLIKRFAPLFLVIEGLELGGVLSSQRATAMGPSVSFVAVIECCLPLFIMLLSFILIASRRFLRVITSEVRDTLRLQLEAIPVKLVSLSLIVVAVGVVQANTF